MKFAETAAIFSHHCTEFICKHRHYVGSDPQMGTQLEYILK